MRKLAQAAGNGMRAQPEKTCQESLCQEEAAIESRMYFDKRHGAREETLCLRTRT